MTERDIAVSVVVSGGSGTSDFAAWGTIRSIHVKPGAETDTYRCQVLDAASKSRWDAGQEGQTGSKHWNDVNTTVGNGTYTMSFANSTNGTYAVIVSMDNAR